MGHHLSFYKVAINAVFSCKFQIEFCHISVDSLTSAHLSPGPENFASTRSTGGLSLRHAIKSLLIPFHIGICALGIRVLAWQCKSYESSHLSVFSA